jgi:hypothetical protein
MDADLCATCLAMVKLVNESEPVSKFGDVWGDSGWVKIPQFQGLCHYTFSDINSAAVAGCKLCSKLQAWLVKHGDESRYKGLDFSAQPSLLPYSGAWKFRFDVSNGDGEELLHPEVSTRLTFACYPLEYSSRDTSAATSDLYRGYGSSNEVFTNTGNASVLGRVDYWFRNCIKNHPACSGDIDPTVYPPRLLDVSKPIVTLVDNTSNLKRAPYAALSHSWGPNPRHLILTTENQTSMKEHIVDDALEPTFRDAVKITRKLGIDYLWIDSLCIIQAGVDHAKDWLGHAAIMGSIYQSCAINIAAAHGSDASAGCFVNRNPSEIAPCIIELRKVVTINTSDGEEPTVERDTNPSSHILVPEPLSTEGVDHFHLDTRGWVCQERLLSPRTIHFAKDQLFWECSGSQNVCETIPEGIWSDKLPKVDEFPYSGDAIGIGFSWGTMQFDEGTTPYGWRAPNSREQYEWWLKTLHGYVKRSLTKSSDKLPAIGGIAERTATTLNDKYLAGLFQSHLPDALLWSCVQERRPKHARNTDEFFAPSWSWGSLNGDIDFTPLENSESRHLCTVLGSEIQLIDPQNPFGQVNFASLKLKGPFLSFPRDLLEDPENWTYHFGSLRLKGFAGKKQLLYFDFDPTTLECSTLSLLVVRENSRVTTYPGSGNMEEAGLILAPDPAQPDARFIRIGVFKGTEYDEEDRNKEYPYCVEVTIV